MQGRLRVDQNRWSLEYKDGTVINVTSHSGNMPKPEYPTVDRNEDPPCVKGTISYPVPPKKRPEFVVYAPVDDSETWKWKVR